MRRILAVVVLGAMLFGVHMGLRYAYFRYVVGPTRPFCKQRDFDGRSGRYDVLLMGDSVVEYGIQPEHFDSAYNFATAAESIYETYYKLERTLDRHPGKVGLVLVGFGLDTFTERRLHLEENRAFHGQYVDFLDVARTLGDWKYACRIFSDRWFPYAGGLRTAILAQKTDTAGSRRYVGTVLAHQGYCPRSNIELPQTPVYGEAYGSPTPAQSAAWFRPAAVEYMRRISRLCQARGVRLAFVIMPASSPYLAQCGKTVPVGEFGQRVGQALNGEGDAVLLDFLEAFRGRDYLFCDLIHLNDIGGAAVSRALRRQLGAMGMLPPEPPVPAVAVPNRANYVDDGGLDSWTPAQPLPTGWQYRKNPKDAPSQIARVVDERDGRGTVLQQTWTRGDSIDGVSTLLRYVAAPLKPYTVYRVSFVAMATKGANARVTVADVRGDNVDDHPKMLYSADITGSGYRPYTMIFATGARPSAAIVTNCPNSATFPVAVRFDNWKLEELCPLG